MNTHCFSVRRVAAFGITAALVLTGSATAFAQQSLPSNTSLDQSPTAQVPVQPPLSPAADAVRAALTTVFPGDTAILEAYRARGFAPIWLNDEGEATIAARELVIALKLAGNHALPAAKYRGTALEGRLDTPSFKLEADLTRAYISYATDVASGLLEPLNVDPELIIYPDRPLSGDLVRRAGAAADMSAFLASLPPQDPAYARLVERFAAFRLPAAQSIWGASVSPGRTLRPGDRDSRVGEARARLTAKGDLDPNVYYQQSEVEADGTQVAANDVTTDVPVQTLDPNHFDAPMVEALQRFQARHGLNLDGVIGPATMRQLNVSPGERAEQIAVNLERLRWMNRDLGDHHIMVNLAGFTMSVVRNGREEFSSRVVVGKAREHRTPEFSDTMTHMVINPSWHVPRSIATKEILPKLKANPGYLAAKGMRLIGADASAIDWSTITPRNFPGRITQRPGRGNALGTVKFMFPNKYAIYLHDTPSKRLFKRDVRAFSHGCVRVEKPHEFAAYLLKGQQADPEGYFRRILSTRRERQVNLEEPVPVHLSYRTAWIDQSGVEQFRGDIYGRDSRVAQALSAAGVSILQ